MTFVAFLQARTPAFLAVVMAAMGAQAQVNYMIIKKADKSVTEIPTGDVEDVSFAVKDYITVNGVKFTMIKVYGGSWGRTDVYCQSVFRYGFEPTFRYNNLGLRLAL